MIVSEKHHFLYIAVAKTGTSLLETHLTEHINKEDCIRINRPAAFANGGLHKHSRHIDIVNAIPACKAYWKFAFVRNPYDRVVSWFSYLTQGLNGKAVKKKHLAAYGSRYLSGDFKDFIMHCPPWIFNNHFCFLVQSPPRHRPGWSSCSGGGCVSGVFPFHVYPPAHPSSGRSHTVTRHCVCVGGTVA